MAQAIMEQLTGDAITVASAGSHLKPLHPNAVRVMREHGIDISTRQSRHLNTLAGQRFDHLITLCDRLREICPEFPGPAKGLAEAIHWSIPDPATAGGSGRRQRQRQAAARKTPHRPGRRPPATLTEH